MSMDFSLKLPDNKAFSTLHFRTNAYQCKPLTISKDKNVTLKVKHFFLLKELQSKCVVLGVEIYVYLTFQDSSLTRHIFVLKADTTGLSSVRFSAAEVVLEFVDYLVKVNPEIYYEHASFWSKDESKEKSQSSVDSHPAESEYAIVNDLLQLGERVKNEPGFLRNLSFYLSRESRRGNSKEFSLQRPTLLTTKISLFTRAADAYIFPESAKNTGKHVASGNLLFRWWIALLVKITDESWVCKADIPGSEARAVERFLPELKNWSRGNIYVSSENNSYAIRSIPLFPDDPKGRFLEHLIVENRYKGMNTTRYWEELGFRQEFRLGNVVGIIGCNNQQREIAGIVEDTSTMMTTRKQYKALHELVKGEDYSKKEDIQGMCETGILELCSRLGLNLIDKTVTGSCVAPVNRLHLAQQTDQPRQITNLTGLVKRKKK